MDECLNDPADAELGGESTTAGGADPAHGSETGRKRGQRNDQHVATKAGWDQEHGDADDGLDFAGDVLPGLLNVPLRVMAEATGLSEGYSSFVRRGQKVPHWRHWEVLARLAGD